MHRNKKVITFTVAVSVSVCVVTGWAAYGVFSYRHAVEAAGGFPYQVGLTKTVITPCILTPAGVCAGHPLCASAPGACAAYSGVSGAPAGGMGSDVLLRDDVIAKIGLVAGANYIGGGTSPVFMHASASVGGWSYAISKRINSAVEFIIAGLSGK